MTVRIAAYPEQIRLNARMRQVEIDWSDGRHGRYGFDLLRQSCRCSECRSFALRTGEPVAVNDAIALENISPVGQYAVQLHFSDGHERGIYPFAYLRELESV